MKALTLRQPWATLAASGAKRIETRSWSTPYRGPLAIHAGLALPGGIRRHCAAAPLRAFLEAAGAWPLDALPRGAVLAVVHLGGCERIGPGGTVGSGGPPGEPERMFGDYAPGRWAWLLREPRPLPRPVAARGALGLWEWASSGDGADPFEPPAAGSPPAAR